MGAASRAAQPAQLSTELSAHGARPLRVSWALAAHMLMGCVVAMDTSLAWAAKIEAIACPTVTNSAGGMASCAAVEAQAGRELNDVRTHGHGHGQGQGHGQGHV